MIIGDKMKLYLVRHGSTRWNEEGRLQGTTDVPISNLGIKQANDVKVKLRDVNFDVCVSSPLLRAKQTAFIIVDGKVEVLTDALLTERELGGFEGKAHEEYERLNYWDYQENLSINGVEGIKDLFSRTKLFLDGLKRDYPNKTVLVVSHGATLRAIHYNVVGYDENTKFLEFKINNGDVYEYEL